MIVFGPRNID